MGLSNEERFFKMCHGVNRISKAADKLADDKYQYVKLHKLAANIWYDFLKGESNGLLWFTGTSFGSDHMSGLSLPGAAFESHIPSRGNTLDEMIEKNVDKHGGRDYFEYYKLVRDQFCSCVRLLASQDEHKAAVMEIYLDTEFISYALCRYNDDFAKSFEDLNRTVRLIQGECFNFFHKNPAYCHAWMIQHIVDKVLTYNEDDLVNQWWQKHNLHHDMRIEYTEFDKIYEIYKKMQFREQGINDRIALTLKLAGPRYGEFEHQHKEFREMIAEHNKKKGVEKVKVKEVEKLLAECKKLHEAKKKKDESHHYQSCDFTNNYVDRDGKVQNIWERN